MGFFKKLAGGSKGDEKKKADKSSAIEEAFSQPALPPGFYGNFPPSFNVYFAGPSDDQKINYFFLGTEDKEKITPLNVFTVNHKGKISRVQITLYSGPNETTNPLALGGNEKNFSSTSIIGLPPPAAGSEAAATKNRVERLVPGTKIKYEESTFSVAVGTSGSENQQVENFEWRSDNTINPPKDKPFERRLVRLNNSEEVVVTFIEEASPEKAAKLGVFQFQGSGATGELGQYWTLMAVMTLLRMNQIRWVAAAAADKLLKAGANVAGAGLGFGLGAI